MSFFTEILTTALGTIAVSDGSNVMGVNVDGSINVRIISGGGGGGSNPAAGPTGSAVPADADYNGVSVSGTLQGSTGFSVGAQIAMAVAIVDGSGNQIVSFGGGQQYADSAASGGAPTGTLAMGWDSSASKIRALKVDSSQGLEVALEIGGTVYDARQIRALTSSDEVTIAVSGSQVPTANSINTGGFPASIAVDVNILSIRGTAPSAAGYLDVKMFDGTHGPVAVKAANTAAVSADASFVVALSPNSPLPSGTNLVGHVLVDGFVNIEASSTPLTVSFDGSPAVASLNVHVTNPTSSTVLQGSNPWVIAGNKVNNAAAPDGGNVGVLPAIANAAAPTLNEGDLVLLSSDLAGNLRVNVKQYVAQTNISATQATGIVVMGSQSNQGGGTLSALHVTPASPSGDSLGGPGGLFVASESFNSTPLGGSVSSWSSATPLNTVVFIMSGNAGVNFEVYGVVGLDMTTNGTITSGSVIFEVSADANKWVPAMGVQLGTQTVITGAVSLAGTNVNTQILFNTQGCFALRARLATAIVGSGTVNIVATGRSLGEGVVSTIIVGTATCNMQASSTPLTTTFFGSPAVSALNVWVANMDSPVRASKSVTLTTTALTQLVQGVGGKFMDLSHLDYSNQNVATGVLLTLTDGTLTYAYWVPANSSGLSLDFDPPLAATNIGQGWTAKISAAITGGVNVNVQAVQR